MTLTVHTARYGSEDAALGAAIMAESRGPYRADVRPDRGLFRVDVRIVMARKSTPAPLQGRSPDP